MEDQRILHYFIGTICNFAPATAPVTQVPDNQVVQEDDNYADNLHQSEEIIEDVIEDTEVPFDIDKDDDAVLGSLLIPIEKTDTHEDVYAEISVEEDLLPPGLLDEAIMKYTDPAGNTFEAPIVPEPDPEDDDDDIPQMPAPEPENDAFEYKVEEANLDLIPEKVEELQEANFDLDFNTDDAEEDTDNVPDFF
jgi:hypothetical protein